MKKKKRTVRDENYYSIFGWMTNPDGMALSGLELSVYAIIYGFSQGGDNAFSGSLQYLADFTNSTERGIRKCLSSLVEKGYLKKEKIQYNKYSYTAIILEQETKEDVDLSMRNRVPHDEEQSSAQSGTEFRMMRNRVPHDEEQSSANKKENYINNIYINNARTRVTEKKSSVKKISQNKFKNFPQRNTDMKALEEALLNRPYRLRAGDDSS